MSHAASPPAVPTVLRTLATDRTLSVPLALSYQQVVLERRTANGWKPLAVQYPRTLSREQMRNITFTLPPGVQEADVRVLGYRAAKFPSRFVHGNRVFSRSDTASAVNGAVGLDRLRTAPVPELAAAVKGREPDLWQVVNNQLFVYNQYRGLQVMDLVNPASPLRTGVLRLPAAGVRLFVLDAAGTRLALLGRSNGRNRSGGVSLFLLRVESGEPVLVSELPLDGKLTDGLWTGKQLCLLGTVKDAKLGSRTQMIRLNVDDLQAVKVVQRLNFSGTHPAFRSQAGKLMVQVSEAGQNRLHEVAVEGGAEQLEARAALAGPSKINGYEISISDRKLRVHKLGETGKAVFEMSLAWRADRVLPLGDFLIQVEDGDVHSTEVAGAQDAAADAGGQARVRITTANDPDLLVGEWQLGPGKVAGLTLRGEHLLIAQWVPASHSQQPLLRTWALDLGDPASVSRLGVVDQELQGLDAWDLNLGAVQALWVNDETLVWYIPADHHPRLWWSSPMSVQPAERKAGSLVPATSPVMVLCRVHWRDGILDAAEPQVLRVRGRVLATSAATVASGFLFFSYDISNDADMPSANEGGTARVPLRPMPGQIHSWMQVMDFRGVAPLPRDAVSIPGPLLTVAQTDSQGALLLTHSDMSLRSDLPPTRVVQACAYDGVNAYLLDDYVTATSFQSAVAVEGVQMYLTREMGRAGVVAVGYDSATGRLGQVSSWNTLARPTRLHVTSGHLLASGPGNLEVASLATETGKLTPVASYDTPVNLTLQVDRAAVTPTLDLWIPAGMFGVEFLQRQSLQP
ncbi:MAG: hypothetical protein V4672_10950 [Verrucomicrobiota bacterium]